MNFNALGFASQIEELGRRVVGILKEEGIFLVRHLRYETNMSVVSDYMLNSLETKMHVNKKCS